MRARLISWRTSDHYIKGATSRDMGTHGEAQRLSRRAVARGLDPAVVHDLIRHHPTTDIEDIFKVAEALERATPN
jgi:hypothetical protein